MISASNQNTIELLVLGCLVRRLTVRFTTVQSKFEFLVNKMRFFRHFFSRSKDLGVCEIIRDAGKVSTARWTVPDHIIKPPYYETMEPTKQTLGKIEIKTDEQIWRMRESCKLAANILKSCSAVAKVSIHSFLIDHSLAFCHFSPELRQTRSTSLFTMK